jgi:hypothetical protein
MAMAHFPHSRSSQTVAAPTNDSTIVFELEMTTSDNDESFVAALADVLYADWCEHTDEATCGDVPLAIAA